MPTNTRLTRDDAPISAARISARLDGALTELRRELAEAAGVAVGRIIGFERLSGLTD